MKKIYLFIILVAGLWLNACNPKDLQPTNDDKLYTITAADSLVTLPQTVDFARVSQQGKGPAGKVIRLTWTNTPESNIAYTYNDMGDLTGIYQPLSYGYDAYQLADYNDGLLSKMYAGIGDYMGTPSTVKITGITLYRYNANRQLAMALQYNKSYQEPAKGELNQVHEFRYTAAGQLETTRITYKSGEWHEATWNKGNIEQENRYFVPPATYPKDFITSSKEIVTFEYDQQPNVWLQRGPLNFPTYSSGTANNVVRYINQRYQNNNGTGRDETAMERRINYNQQGAIDRAEFRYIYSPTDTSFWMGYAYTYADGTKK